MTEIKRPTCWTCIYCDRIGITGRCRHTSSLPREVGTDEWCGDHQDFNDYERILESARPHCVSCVHMVLTTVDTRRGDGEVGTCSLKGGESMWAPYDSCYAHEGKK